MEHIQLAYEPRCIHCGSDQLIHVPEKDGSEIASCMVCGGAFTEAEYHRFHRNRAGAGPGGDSLADAPREIFNK